MNSSDFDAALAEVNVLLDRFAHFGVELGLERIERLLQALGNPQHQVPVLHVAGSNGKGSVCAYLASVLTAAGYRVGRYTSPHLVSWCERICIDEEISPTELLAVLRQVVAAIDPHQSSPTQFEVITAAGWLYFAQQQVDLAVMEVGLGGRLDATNVCDRPLVSLITSLSREHWQRLGFTLAEITFEKAGILKPHCPAVIAPQPPEAIEVLQQRIQELACPVVWVEPAVDLGDGWAEVELREQGIGNREQGIGNREQGTGGGRIKYLLPLPGAHQLVNSAVAIAGLQVLRHQGWQISDRNICEGMAKTHWPGRLQWGSWQGHPLLIDGAHNPAGAAALRAYVDTAAQIQHPITWIMGMISTKDHADVFEALLRPGDRLLLVPVPEHLPTDLEMLATLAQKVCPGLAECLVTEDVFAALTIAFTGNSTVVLCGSLYLIGHFFQQASQQITSEAQS